MEKIGRKACHGTKQRNIQKAKARTKGRRTEMVGVSTLGQRVLK
jgi:hypothetical protein